MKRRRWQVDLRLADELTLAQARRVLGADGDSETLRSLLALFAKRFTGIYASFATRNGISLARRGPPFMA